MTTSPDGTSPIAPVDGTVVPRFAGAGTFARLARIDEVHDYDIAILGVPFDGGTSYRPGARFGPLAVRNASRNLRPAYDPELEIAPFRSVQAVDAGDVAANPFSIADAIDAIGRVASSLLTPRSRLIAIGGDHTVALPLIEAAHALHGPVALVHFDAHLDTWGSYFGAPLTHGTVFRRAFERGLLVEDHSIHVGIRGPLYDTSDLDQDRAFGFEIVRARELDGLGCRAVAERIRARVGSCPVYLSVDIDVLDPAFAPGTGTPEAGGFTSRELLEMLRLIDGLPIVGADVVEVAPAYDHAEITALAGATVVFGIAGLMARTSVRGDTRQG